MYESTQAVTVARSTAYEVDERELSLVLKGLMATPPRISPRWFYDAVGSALFEAITRVPEYYPTGCEIEILRTCSAAIARALPPRLAVVELGSGSARKVGRLLPALREPRSYNPIDVSRTALDATAAEIAAILPHLPVEGLCADFTRPRETDALLSRVSTAGPVLVFFPGSTIGNFDEEEAIELLAAIGRCLPTGTPMLLGVDLVKAPALLEGAYNDPVGVTSAFNRNVLAHLNRRFGSDFDLRRWRHEARWVPERYRVEMWLRSCGAQRVRFGGALLEFRDGDGIHTESCHKWDHPRLDALAHASGWELRHWWTDSRSWFAEALLTRATAN